ncbi:hypothetical protein ICW40_06395 [Actinotalea ferrariae]|uniref:hypothetical protein n=1 Tax=Actinotalea ferrariae TaxID=1386098 RepID=UPI001C8CE0F7|nr:hypothetical protein [Actinotalea ferrariae]MBX9244434.1 hypothetical protein [Actinotalea ferrariae]
MTSDTPAGVVVGGRAASSLVARPTARASRGAPERAAGTAGETTSYRPAEVA